MISEAPQPINLVFGTLGLLVKIFGGWFRAFLVNLTVSLLVELRVGCLAGSNILEDKAAVLAEQILYGESKRLHLLKTTELQTAAQWTSRLGHFVAHRFLGVLLVLWFRLLFCIGFLFQYCPRVNLKKALVVDLGYLFLPFRMAFVFCQQILQAEIFSSIKSSINLVGKLQIFGGVHREAQMPQAGLDIHHLHFESARQIIEIRHDMLALIRLVSFPPGSL